MISKVINIANYRHAPLPPRQCAICNRILPLNAQHFRRDLRRHPWSLAGWGYRCIDCDREARREQYRRRQLEEPGREAAIRKAHRDRVKAAGVVLLAPAPSMAAQRERGRQRIALERAKRAAANRRRELTAAVNRDAQAARLRAGITHAVSWVQRKIEADCTRARERRLAPRAPATSSDYVDPSLDVDPDYQAALEALRDKHRRENER